MNVLEASTAITPSGLEEECAKFTIDTVLSPFMIRGVTVPDEIYTMGLWVKSDNPGSIVIRGRTMESTNEWSRHVVTYTASGKDLQILFNTEDVYYIYHPKLELGSKDTDWTEAPEDVIYRVNKTNETAANASNMATNNSTRLDRAESLIEQLVDRISMIVTDSSGTSLWEQTADSGWTFSMAQTQESIETIRGLINDTNLAVGSTDATVEALRGAMNDITNSFEWVKVTTYQDEPCIILGETDSDFRLLITNTRIMFMEGSNIPAYISNQALNIKKAIIEDELKQGNFVWKIRSNGNMGLVWKG